MRREIGGMLIAMGAFMVIFSMIQMDTQGNTWQGSTAYGGVILIGPIPIIFGSSSEMADIAAFLSIALMIISFLLFGRMR
jgi:uncharacterized protein (TIGR00304 family)